MIGFISDLKATRTVISYVEICLRTLNYLKYVLNTMYMQCSPIISLLTPADLDIIEELFGNGSKCESHSRNLFKT